MSDSEYHRQYYIRNRDKLKARSRARYRAKKDEVIAQTRAYQRANPSYLRRWRLKSKFGITPEQYEDMLAAQGGVCVLCLKPEPSDRYMPVDHCHKTGKIRGLLCMLCNTLLGRVEDSPEFFQRGLDYLQRSQ